MQSVSPHLGAARELEHGAHRGWCQPTPRKLENNLWGTDPRVSVSSLSAVAAVRNQSLDITITTAEGDRFTLSSKSSVTTAFATYQGTSGATQIRSAAATTSSSLDSSLVVEGNLSHAELKDIAKALQAYTKVLRDVLSGNREPVQAHANQISRLDEIAGFDASFTSQQAFSAETQSAAVAVS
jgi:hypothetical protein